jgi:hypothetical protein
VPAAGRPSINLDAAPPMIVVLKRATCSTGRAFLFDSEAHALFFLPDRAVQTIVNQSVVVGSALTRYYYGFDREAL